MLNTPVGRLRAIGLIEGTSFLVLLAVMPLKHFYGIPEPVQYVGAAHGGLWVIYLAVLAVTSWQIRWNWRWILAGFVASVLPLGPFVFDHWLKKREHVASTSTEVM